jgi:hypothetical protein
VRTRSSLKARWRRSIVAPPRISQADVFRAADELLVEGYRPSIDRVRMRLGRGSPNTINDHMETWWTKLRSRLRDLPSGTFPQVPEWVGHALQLLWNEALAGAHERLQGALLEREQGMAQQEQALQTRIRELADREQGAATRAAAIEESLGLVRINGPKIWKPLSGAGTPNVPACATR